ncbi:MAG: electron transport complex subunit RsxE [Clostridia bacterium]|nr:electron transport complex subunit RsxE [Clostridia bacterium]
MKKDSKLMILLRGIVIENPVLILILGTCPTLAMTKSIVSAVSMGIAATIVLICSNVVISALRKVIPDSVRIPCYIVIIAGFVTAVQMLLNAYLLPIYVLLGPYLALIVVNCIILGRAEMFARKNNVGRSALDGIGMGIGFLLALFAIAAIREILGTGMIDLSALGIENAIKIPLLSDYNLPILTQAPGGFLVYGIVIAIVNFLTRKRGGIKKKSFSCEGCPSASSCNGGCGATEATEEKEVG